MWYAFALVSGLTVTILEFAAVRLAAPFFGQSQLVWANVVSVVLACLACGSAIGGRLAERRADATALGRVAIAAGLLALVAPLLGPRFDRWLLPEGFSLGPELSFALLGSLASTLVLFGPPFVLLGAATPLLLRAVAPGGPPGREAGLVLASSTIGSVAGCYLTALALVPLLGTRRTLLLAAGALIALGAALLLRGRAARAGAALAAVLAAPILVPPLPLKGAGIPGDRVLFESDSALQLVRVLERREERPDHRGERPLVRVLALDEGDAEYHSVFYPEGAGAEGGGRVDSGGRYYDALAALPSLLDRDAASSEKVRVLVVGFAAGTVHRVLAHVLGERLELVGVEIDPVVLDAAKRCFGLDPAAPGLTCVVADGRAYVNQLPAGARFDIVFVDAYAHQQYVPFQVATVEFFRKLRAALASDGILAVNLDRRSPGARLPRAIGDTVVAAGFHATSLLPIPGFPSVLLIARKEGDRPWIPLAPAAPPFQRVTNEWWKGLIGYVPAEERLVLEDDLAPIERIIDSSLLRPASAAREASSR